MATTWLAPPAPHSHIPLVYGSFALAGLVVSSVMGKLLPRQKSLTWVVSTAVSAWVPTAHGNYMAIVLGQAAVPVVGKAGALPTFAGEAIVAGVCALGTILVFHSLMPAVHSLSSKHRATLRRSMITVWIVGVVFAYVDSWCPLVPAPPPHCTRRAVRLVTRLAHLVLVAVAMAVAMAVVSCVTPGLSHTRTRTQGLSA